MWHQEGWIQRVEPKRKKPAELYDTMSVMVDLRRFEGSNLSSGKARVYIRASIPDIGLIWQRGHDPPAAEAMKESAVRRRRLIVARIAPAY